MSQKSAGVSHTTLRHRDAGGIHFMERAGDGVPLVFLHGIGSNSDSFLPLFEQVRSGRRLIAWNAPGYLSSAALKDATPTAQAYAAAFERFLDHLGIAVAHVVGHSLGTLIGAAFAARAPDRVASLTLAASAQGYGMAAGEGLPPGAARRLDDLATLGPAAFAEVRAPRLVFAPDQNPGVLDRVRAEMARINPVGYAQAVHMLASGDLSGTMARVNIRPGFIIGAEDRVTPFAQTDAALRAWADAHGDTPACISIPAAGHAVYVQVPQAFSDALLKLVPCLRPDADVQAEGELHGG